MTNVSRWIGSCRPSWTNRPRRAPRARSLTRFAATSWSATWPAGPSALYNPALEKDACGVGFVADMKNRKSHAIVSKGLDILRNLSTAARSEPTRRRATVAACSCRSRIGSSGRRRPSSASRFPSPATMPSASSSAARSRRRAGLPRHHREGDRDEGFRLLGFRVPPTDNSDLGFSVKPTEPRHLQVFVGRDSQSTDEDTFERGSSSCGR